PFRDEQSRHAAVVDDTVAQRRLGLRTEGRDAGPRRRRDVTALEQDSSLGNFYRRGAFLLLARRQRTNGQPADRGRVGQDAQAGGILALDHDGRTGAVTDNCDITMQDQRVGVDARTDADARALLRLAEGGMDALEVAALGSDDDRRPFVLAVFAFFEVLFF